MEFESALVRFCFWTVFLAVLIGGKPWVIPSAGKPWLDRVLANGSEQNRVTFFTFDAPEF